MMFYDDDVSGWGWFWMSAGMVLFWGLLIVVVILAVRAATRFPEQSHRPATPSAEEVLAERFARGEIDQDEYRRRLKTLRSIDHLTPS